MTCIGHGSLLLKKPKLNKIDKNLNLIKKNTRTNLFPIFRFSYSTLS